MTTTRNPAACMRRACCWGSTPSSSAAAGRPTSLPTQIPTTIEGITGDQIEERINATDSEDALKYFPT